MIYLPMDTLFFFFFSKSFSFQKNEFKRLKPALTMAKMAGLKITIHCGKYNL